LSNFMSNEVSIFITLSSNSYSVYHLSFAQSLIIFHVDIKSCSIFSASDFQSVDVQLPANQKTVIFILFYSN
jgi:hypothetical protein